MSDNKDIASICKSEAEASDGDDGRKIIESEYTVGKETMSDINSNTSSAVDVSETSKIRDEDKVIKDQGNEIIIDQGNVSKNTAINDECALQDHYSSPTKQTGVENTDGNVGNDENIVDEDKPENSNNEEELAEDKTDIHVPKSIKKILNCGSGRSKLLDEDTTPYGITEYIQNTKETHERTVKRQSSFKKAMTSIISENPTEGTFTTIKISQSKDKTRLVQENYISQSNIQRYPDPKKVYSVKVDPDRYDFSHPQRGYMVMIVNDRFRRESFRDGAHWDLIKMREFARKFGFRIFNHDRDRNVTKGETLRLLRGAQHMDHSESDCFVFMISSHGLEMSNPRAGGKKDHALICSDDQYIFISDILEMFSDTNCPTLKNKPKIFIVQACRGTNLDHGSDMFVMHTKRPVDKTCGVQQADFVTPNVKKLSSKKESVDEADTNPGGDSWASRPTPGQVSAIGGLPSERLRYSVEPSGVRYNPPLPRGQEGAVGGLPVTNAQYGNVSSSGQATFQQRTPFFAPVQGMHGAHGVQTHTSQSINKMYVPVTPYAVCETPSLKCGNDMLILYAIPPGMFAWRNTSDGSWMIDYFHQIMMAYDMRTPKNFLTLLTKVAFLMSKRETHTPSDRTTDRKKAIPVIEHALTKDIFFQPKAVQSSWTRNNLEFSL